MKYMDFKNCVIEAAEKMGLVDYELYYTESEDVSTSALMHELKDYSSSSDAGACFRCIYQGKMGYASTELFTEEEAVRMVESAMGNATVIESEDEVFIHGTGDVYEAIEPVKTTEPTGAELIDAAMTLLEK